MASQGKLFKFLNVLGNYRTILNNRPLIINYQQNNGLKKDTKEKLEKLNIPDKPKKPQTPFFRFISDQRATILKENPDFKIGEISKKCSELWKNVDNSLKERYDKQYKTELEEYSKQMLTYKAKLSDEQREAIMDVNTEKRIDRERRKMRKRLRDTNKPKRPMGAFMHFLLEEAKAVKKNPLKISKDVKEKWYTLPEPEKARYQNIYLECKQKYEEELKNWEQKMIAQGNSDLVRVSQLKSTPSKPKISKKKDVDPE